MGHQIEQKLSAGACELTQCSCGRGALKIKDKVILLSSAEISKIFSGLVQPVKPSLSNKLNQLMGGQPWTDFSLPE